MKIEEWSPKQAEKEIGQRLKDALEARKTEEYRWQQNESLLFETLPVDQLDFPFSIQDEEDNSDIQSNYTLKYHRFLHSQMVANPPAVMPRPTSGEYKDKRSADAADAFVRYGRTKYKLARTVGLACGYTLTYGSGFVKSWQDPDKGEFIRIEDDGEVILTGDYSAYALTPWDIAIDHTAQCWDDSRYVFERHLVSLEEAQARFPKNKDMLKQYAQTDFKNYENVGERNRTRKGLVAIWEYIEKALPWNGMRGRRCFLLEDGKLLSPVTENTYVDACIPIMHLGDIDVPGQVWCKSIVDYVAKLQDTLDRLDSTILGQIQAHGVIRMIVFDEDDSSENRPSNNYWDIQKLASSPGQMPMFAPTPQIMPDIHRFRQVLVDLIGELFGVNESMMGKIPRELSGFSVQTAINAGNMVRHWLYTKYEEFVEAIYRNYLRNIQVHWKTKKKLVVAGEENAFSTVYFSGASIEEGWDLQVEYGTSLSLDPPSRREEIIQLMPTLKEAGYSPRRIISMLKLADLGEIYDEAKIAEERQLEIVEKMAASFEEGVLSYIAPEEGEDHLNMLEALKRFRMRRAYQKLDEEVQALVMQHYKERLALAAKEAAPEPEPGPATQEPLPEEPLLPAEEVAEDLSAF